MQGQVYEQLTLFPEASPASPSVWLASKRAKGTTVTYGLKCSELSENLRRVGSLVRTYLESCALPLPTLYRTWSARAITPSCLILKLRLSERRTGGNASRSLHTGQLWPTPKASDCKGSGPVGSKSAEHDRKKRNLKGAVMYPTVTAADAQGTSGGNMHGSLRTDAGGQLNPTWVEWLMGYPSGWTELDA